MLGLTEARSRSGRGNLIYTKHHDQDRVLGNRDLPVIIKLAYAAGAVLVESMIQRSKKYPQN